MKVLRFSAIENFGVPVDTPNQINTTRDALKLMSDYGIEGQEVSTDITDITPYYFKNPAFRYLLTRKTEDDPVVVNLMPTADDSGAFEVAATRDAIVGIEIAERSIRIPTDQEMMAIGGPGPRFAGQLCIHEMIARVR